MKLAARDQPGSKPVLSGVLAVLGLSFWFVLGFPFANSNESYIWLAQLKPFSWVDALTRRIVPVATFRPLGIFTAWLGYTASGGSIFPQQVFNFVGALVAWLILFIAIPEKKLFGWMALVVGGGFFSGYIYLFHLHGVFYSPLLIFLAILLAVVVGPGRFGVRGLISLGALAMLTALYHPFALVLFVAYLIGTALEQRAALSGKLWLTGGVFLVAMLGLLKILVPSQGLQLTTDVIQGFVTSYRAVELNVILSLVAWLLSLVTILSLTAAGRTKAILIVVVSAALPILLRVQLPFLFVWLLLCLLKAARLRKWSLALLMLASAALPAATATGSPTYVLPVLMTGSFVTALGWPYLEKDTPWQNSVSVAAVALAMAVVIPLKLGVHLPVISNLVNPVLAEKEKTFQLENVIGWYAASSYAHDPLELCEHADNPAESANALDRTYRPPTSQNYLDAYLASIGASHSPAGSGRLLVCFGGETVLNAVQVYRLAGKYAGNAVVFECAETETAACSVRPGR